MRPSLPTLFILFLGTCVLLGAGCLARGQKLLLLEIVNGSEVVLATNFDADDTSSVGEIWEAAGEVPFATQAIGPSLHASADDPLIAALAGSVEIRISHVGTLETSARLSDVTLVRSSPTSDDWRLPAREISRARGAAGL